jgi:hypothetical protein
MEEEGGIGDELQALSFISAATLLVKAIAKILEGSTPILEIK